MSSSEERMLILNMLKEGKITSEEAARLLEALDGNTKQSTGDNTAKQQTKQPDFNEELNKVKDKLKDWTNDFKKNYNEKDFDKLVDDLSVKAEKIGKNVASTTVGIVDRVIDYVGSFVDTNAFNLFGNFAAVDKSFEAIASEGMNLNIEAENGNIVVKKHLDDKIIIRSRIRTGMSNADNALIFLEAGNEVSLKINTEGGAGNSSISHEVFLPAVKFGSVKLTTKNGKIYVEDSKSSYFEALTKNANIELMGVNSEEINANTKNAKVQVSYVIADKIDINTTNAVIDVKHVKTADTNVYTTNGRILVENVQNVEGVSDINMTLKTTNASIKINMNDMENRGYKVKGRTTNGSINLLIPEMTYHNVNRQGVGGNFVEAESSGFASAAEKISVTAETSNGFIEIVK